MKIMNLSFVTVVLLLILSCKNTKKVEPKTQAESSILPKSYLLYEDFPSKNISQRNVEIWLPENYERLDSLPVLYMFDGQNIFHGIRGWGGEYNDGWQVDDVLDSLIKAGAIPDVMVVGVYNSLNRMAEYMPAKPKGLLAKRIAETNQEWYKSFKTDPPVSDALLKFIVKELKPFVDTNFKTKSDRANTYVTGSSMGGLISAYAICEYPEVFGGAACFSTHWPPLEGVFLEYLKENLPDPKTHKIYFDYGTKGLDATYEPFQKRADAAMEAHGYEKNKNWVTKKFEGEDHHEKYWHGRFTIPMKFLFSKD